MKSIVVLRSYGDFVVLLSSIMTVSDKRDYKIYASIHLKELHDALFPKNDSGIAIHFFDLGINTGILPLFTNKHFFSLSNLKTIQALNLFLKSNKFESSHFFLEQSRRSWLVKLCTGVQLDFIHKASSSIYNSYLNFFNGIQKSDSSFVEKQTYIKKILVFPDSRKQSKVLPGRLIEEITKGVKQAQVNIAKFGNNQKESHKTEILVYDNFKQLVQLINECDFVVSSDSLPAHLAYHLNKPHWVIYNNTINTEWLTPFCIQHKTYTLFSNVDATIKYINSNLC